MADEELTLEQETALVVKMLDNYGVTPPTMLGRIAPVLAIGLTNGAWRNTVVEDWHAGEGPLSDGDMLRINSYTTYGVQKRLSGWMREFGLTADDDAVELDELDPEDIEELVGRIYTWLTRPARKLPTGATLAQLADAAGASVGEYAEDARQALDGVLATALRRGPAFAFLRAAAHGAGACDHWWNHPRWPARVDAYIEELGVPGSQRSSGLGPRPAQIEDLDALRRALLERPWELHGDSAQWVVDAGIRYVQL